MRRLRTGRRLAAVAAWATAAVCTAQTYTLEQRHDSLSVLTLTTDAGHQDHWTLPYPVYRLATGDVDGDGSADALVGVVKSTRFHPERGRRLFIFKNCQGYIRPLWLGSRLGGTLHDFRFVDGRVRSLETTADGRYVVADYAWSGFGLAFDCYHAKGVGEDEARQIFNQLSIKH